MERHAQKVGGQGVVGMKLDVRLHHGRENLAEFVAMGTAVAVAGSGHQRLDPTMVLPLNDEDVALTDGPTR
jgi:hypothetical protein